MRCRHGFERELVPCPTCDPQRYKFEPGDGIGAAGVRGPGIHPGCVIAGAEVLAREGPHVIAKCGCGRQFRALLCSLRACARRHAKARCRRCINRDRKEALQAEKPGAAA